MKFPNGKNFAFTIFDDTDNATVKNIAPIYELLMKIGIITTKSVWVFPEKNSRGAYNQGETLQHPHCLAFIKYLLQNGYEISLHDVAPDSSTREHTIEGLNIFKELLGFFPRSYSAHLRNKENIYWDGERVHSPFFKLLMKLYKKQSYEHFQGHKKRSPYFWGDICKQYITYVRNFTFNTINLCKVNPTLPYHDPKKPFVNFWFSSSEAQDRNQFNRLLSSANQEKLEKEHGVCIVYTHFAFGFVEKGSVHPETKRLLEELSKRNGWFVSVSTLLDYLRANQPSSTIPSWELRKMEWRWAIEKGVKRFFL